MTDHPAGNIGVGKTRLWFGLEVEGRLRNSNLWTAFINAPLEEQELRRLSASLKKGETKHLFICEDFNGARAWEWFESVLLALAGARPITVARRGTSADIIPVLEQTWASRVALLVRANEDAGWMERLRPDDQISVGVPYRITTWRVNDGIITTPSDYEGDVE